MSILPIVIAPDERLITRASEVTDINDKIKELVNDMFETVYDAEGLQCDCSCSASGGAEESFCYGYSARGH